MGDLLEDGDRDIRKANGDADALTCDYFVNRCNEGTW